MTYKLIDYERLKAFSEGLKSKYATKHDIPKKLSDLQEDSTHRTVTDNEKSNWNNKIDKSKIVNTYFGNSSDTILSQKAINALVNDFDKAKADKDAIPTKISQLTNDKSFKTESEIQQMIEKASSLKKEVVTSLPTTGKDDVIYLVKDKKGKENNNYLEYLWLNGKYELIGSTQVDLSGYVTHTTFDLYQQESDRQATLIAEMQQITRHALTEQRISQAFPDTQPDKLATSGQLYALYQNMEAISGSIGQMGQGISEYFEQELQKALKKSDIQEFTQQELEEAFK